MAKDGPVHYLDNASTTRVAGEVADVIDATMRGVWANPSSLYRAGLDAEKCVEDARGVLAKALCCKPGEVVFTASGTEASNIAVLGAARARKSWGKKLVATGYEHPAVGAALRALAAQEGFELCEVAPGADGSVDAGRIVSEVGPETALVCTMQVNNEVGAVLDVAGIAAEVKAKNPRCFVHVDGVQGFCKLPLELNKTQIDSCATSGHKLHAPKGVGALYLKGGANILTPLHGGGQERGVRPGTENVPYIAGYAKAVQLAMQNRARNEAHIKMLHARLLEGLAGIEGARVISPGDAAAHIVMFAMPKGLRSQVMLNLLDEAWGVCVSSGSACSGGAKSHTLQAMGLPAQEVDAALRASFCGENTKADVDALLEGLRDCAGRLARRG